VVGPLHRITATAQRLPLSALHERTALDGPDDELRRLSDTFDAMLDRLERAVDSQRRFIANASGGVPVTFRPPGPVVVPGDEVMLAQLATNLVQNTVRHNVPGGTVTITLTGGGLTVRGGLPDLMADT
jgi:hypothetical protein